MRALAPFKSTWGAPETQATLLFTSHQRLSLDLECRNQTEEFSLKLSKPALHINGRERGLRKS